MSRRRPRARPHVPPPKVERVPPVWAFALVTLIAATAMRLCFPVAWGERDSLGSAFLVGDVRPYHDYAAHLVAGRPFDNGIPFHPPGWAIVLAGYFRLAGFDPLNDRPADPALLKAFVAFLSGLTVSLAALVAHGVAGRGAMYATGAWGSIHFGHMVLGTVPSNETIYGLLVVVVALIALRLVGDHPGGFTPRTPLHARSRGPRGPAPLAWRTRAARALLAAAWHSRSIPPDPSPGRIDKLPSNEDRRRYATAALLGLAAGATAIVRAEFLAACVLLGLWIWLIRKGRSDLRLVAAYALGALLALLPTVVSNWRSISAFNERNAIRMPGPLPRFAPVTSYGAFNFAIANHQEADGGPNNDHRILQAAARDEQELLAEGGLNLAAPAVHRLYVDGYRIGLSWILRNPADATRLAIEKGRRALGSLAHGVLFDNVPVGVDGTRRRVDLIDPASRALWPFSLVLTAAGMWMLRGRIEARLLYVPLTAFALSTLGFFGYVRLGVAYLPVIWVFQSVAVAGAAASLPWPGWIRRRQGAAVMILMVTVVGASVGSLSVRRSVTIEGPTDSAGRVIADETVRVTRR
jgi:hypothetical protein